MSQQTNLETLLQILFQAKRGATIKLPYKDRSVHPPKESKIEVTLSEADVQEILTVVKRAKNKELLEGGQATLFKAPIDYPDPEAEIRRRTMKTISQLLLDIESLQTADERLDHLKQLKAAIREIKPSASMKAFEWDKLVRAFKKANPKLSESEILSLFE